MRPRLLRLHLYGGLLCALYLIIFGLTSLTFNHHAAFLERKPKPLEWEQSLNVDSKGDNEAVANNVRDGLGLGGWTIPWKMSRDHQGNLTFDLERPGKSYTVQALFTEKRAKVEERRNGIWDAFRALHAMGDVPNLAFSRYWCIYTEFCVGFTVFAGVSGICLWIQSQRERWVGWVIFLGASASSLGFIGYVIFHG